MPEVSDLSYRRELMLEEMGLQPRWVRRSLLSAHTAAQTDTAVTAPPAPQQHAPARRAPVVAIAPIAPSAPQVQPDANNDERRIAISQMDWTELAASAKSCTACGLCKSRTQAVFSAGQINADLMIVGEAPGADEDKQGEPFVGQAGKLLDAMLECIGRRRSENVYIANVLKCRPPQNRNPLPEEMALCTPYLHRQIALTSPKVLFAVGRFAIEALLQQDAPIKNLRGRIHDYHGIPVIVGYHPAYFLRNSPEKIKGWEDLLLLEQAIKKTKIIELTAP